MTIVGPILFFAQIVLVVLAWRNGWTWKALIPFVLGFLLNMAAAIFYSLSLALLWLGQHPGATTAPSTAVFADYARAAGAVHGLDMTSLFITIPVLLFLAYMANRKPKALRAVPQT